MNWSGFRSVDEWKAALSMLPDGPFFDLMRGYLGTIKTPFSKQKLLDDLSSLLSRSDIQHLLSSYIDETDRLVIAAIAVLNEPAPSELALFFEGDFSFAELHAILLNLEERLLVYRYTDKDQHRLALNPVLRPVLEPVTQNRQILFPCMPLEDEPHDKAAVSHSIPADFLLAAFLSFVYSRPDLLKISGELKKKYREEAVRLLPGIDIESLMGALLNLGLLREEDNSIVPDDERNTAFSRLDRMDRALYLTAGRLYHTVHPAGESRRLSRERLQSWAVLIRSFLEKLDPGFCYPESSIFRIMDIVERSCAPSRRRWDAHTNPLYELRSGMEPLAFRKALVSALCSDGLLQHDPDGYSLVPVPLGTPDAGHKVLVMDAAFSCIVYPEIDFQDLLVLIRFCSLKELGRTMHLEITRDSAVHGFNSSQDAESMIKLLTQLSGVPVDQSLRWSLDEWWKRYKGISLYKGMVLTLAADRRYIAEAEPLASLIRCTLAPGVYLLNVDDENEVIPALNKLGADIIALPQNNDTALSESSGQRSVFQPLERRRERVRAHTVTKDPLKGVLADNSQAKLQLDEDRIQKQIDHFTQLLEKKRLPRESHDELASRIERRLIVSEAQLVAEAVRFEKLEAKGLDYVGKVRVTEQAMTSGSLLEIFWRGSKGEPNRALGTPLALDKSGGELVLVLSPAPRGEKLRLPLGKISLLRRIKRSIFGE